MDAGGARHLRQTLNGGLHLLAGDQHEVRHLVDDDDDEGQRQHVEGLFLEHRFAGFQIEPGLHLAGKNFAFLARLFDALVVAGDITHAQFGH